MNTVGSIKLWDLPTRLWHWLLVSLVAAAFITGLQGGALMVWHGRIGLAIVGLLAFRLVWGLLGSTYARFAQFVRGPRVILAYLQGRWHGVGHNPLGALSILVLLLVLAVQVVTGLVATDDIAFKGPLYRAVSPDLADGLTQFHRQWIWVLGGLVVLHIAAALFYTLVRGDNLIKPMITGKKTVSDPATPSAKGGGLLPLVVALTIALLVVWSANGGLLPPPPPPPPAGTVPDW